MLLVDEVCQETLGSERSLVDAKGDGCGGELGFEVDVALLGLDHRLVLLLEREPPELPEPGGDVVGRVDEVLAEVLLGGAEVVAGAMGGLGDQQVGAVDARPVLSCGARGVDAGVVAKVRGRVPAHGGPVVDRLAVAAEHHVEQAGRTDVPQQPGGVDGGAVLVDVSVCGGVLGVPEDAPVQERDVGQVEEVVHDELIVGLHDDHPPWAGHEPRCRVEERVVGDQGLVGVTVTHPDPHDGVALHYRVARGATVRWDAADAVGVVHAGAGVIEPEPVVGALHHPVVEVTAMQGGEPVRTHVGQCHRGAIGPSVHDHRMPDDQPVHEAAVVELLGPRRYVPGIAQKRHRSSQ